MTMYNLKAGLLALALIGAPAMLGIPGTAAYAAAPSDLDLDANRALANLLRINPAAAAISRQARAVLVFPKIVKAGFIFGAGYGEGVLLQGGHAVHYYNSLTGSWGLQAGAQEYSYVVFLMTKTATEYLARTDGWEFGVGPTVVLVNEGVARNLSTSTLKDNAYAFIYGQEGLMAGVSLEGTKITRIKSGG